MKKNMPGRELVATSNLDRWRAIVTISGDGLFHEVALVEVLVMIAAVPILGVEWYFRAGRLDGGVQASSWGDPRWHRQRSCQVILGLADFPECVLFSI